MSNEADGAGTYEGDEGEDEDEGEEGAEEVAGTSQVRMFSVF